eukprot:480071-Rhodomonas_salina.1
MLAVSWDREGLVLLCMERTALSEPQIFLTLRGPRSVASALEIGCLRERHRQWVSLGSVGGFLWVPTKNEQEMPAPRAFDSFLAQNGPLLRSELLPTPGADMRWRGLRGSRHQINRRRLPLFHHTSVIPPYDLTDEAIISDHSRLL